MSNDSIFKTSWSEVSEAETSYTRLSVPALLSAFLGLGSILVYFSFWFFFFGVIAILLSLFALWTIRNAEGALAGSSLAYLGLGSAIVALVSVSVFWSAYQYGIRREADQFFRLWFVAIQQGDIPRAKEYQTLYSGRSKAANADEWWSAQYKDQHTHRAIHQYIENKLIRTLMALGDKAKVSYYKTLAVMSERETDTVVSVYAVTFPAEFGNTETFFIKMSGVRFYPSEAQKSKAAGWRIENVPVVYLPDEFK